MSGLACCRVKMISAHRAAKARPRDEEPACMTTGRPCGERGVVNGPRVLIHFPW